MTKSNKNETNNNNKEVMENQGVENVNNQASESDNGKTPVNALDSLTLETIIRDAITEHAESRTERYEVYINRDEKKFKPRFIQVVRTYAYLSQIRRPDTSIIITDQYNEDRILNVKAYQAPEFLFDLVNYSGRVYFCDEDRENENYITEATRKASDLSKEELAKHLLSPEDLLSFWRDYNSTTKHQVQLKPLTKPAVALSELSGIVKPDVDVKAGYIYKRFNTTGSVSMTTIQARMVRFDALADCGAETEMLKIAQIVHRVATSISNASSVPEDKEQEFVNAGK